MKKVLLYSLLLVGGLIASQFLAGVGATGIKLATMFCLAFIMIHVGYEFEIDKTRPKQYAWDYIVDKMNMNVVEHPILNNLV